MIDEKKLARLLDLKEQREAIDTEITALMGGEVQSKRGRPRKEKADGAGDTGTVETPLFAGADK
jgi:hypothetical protein